LCGVTNVECIEPRIIGKGEKQALVEKGQSIRRADANKEECLAEIKRITEPQKQLAAATTFDSSVVLSDSPSGLSDVAAEITLGLKPMAELAAQVNAFIEKNYRDEEGQLRHNLRSVKRATYNSHLFRKLSPFASQEIQGRFEVFRSTLKQLGRSDMDVKRNDEKSRLSERKKINLSKESFVEFNVSELLRWCEGVLASLSPNSPWKEVACAVALASGRRATSESLVDASSLEVVDASRVIFQGKAKNHYEKGESVEAFVVPTLVDSALVVAGWNWLQEYKALRSEDFSDVKAARAKAHRKYSSDLGKHWKKLATEVFEIPTDEAAKLHGLRKLYCMVALAREGLVETNDSATTDAIRERAQAILIHEDDKTNEFYRLPLVIVES
jgi:hypothetical protein